MWLLNSSIGKKLVMSISGIFLICFLLFHLTMNVTAAFSGSAYNTICSLLGANWYAVVGTVVLAAFVALHFIYAFILTLQNRKARGNDRYAVTSKPKQVEWASQNMFVLGLIVFGFLALHLFHFWAKMQLVELQYGHDWAAAGAHNPQDGAYFINASFSNPIFSIIYIVWLVALWFHLTHGVWSSLHSIGLNNKTWLPRVKKISNVYSTIIILLFIAIPVYFLLGFRVL